MVESNDLEQIATREEALALVRDYINNERSLLPEDPGVWFIYLSKEPLTSLKTYRDSVPFEHFPKAGAWVAFVDLMPAANYGHPCEYVLISPDKKCHVKKEGFFPEKWEELFQIENY